MPDSPGSAQDWTEPGAFEVVPGVHRIPLPLRFDALKAVNVYALEDGERLTLIDAGWALEEARQVLEDCLGRIGYDLGAVQRFLVTHVHRDHYTLATVVRRLFGSRIALGEDERDSLVGVREAENTGAPVSEISRLFRYGAEDLARRLLEKGDWDAIDPGLWEDPDEWLSDGMRLPVGARTLEAVHTPGHTRGHLVFVDAAAGLMFSGDHILPHITPSIGFERARPDRPLRDYLRSVRLTLRLPDLRMLPAHGPVAPSVHARSDELLAHHRRRLDETAATVAQGARTAYDSAKLLTWTRHHRRFDELNGFNQMLAVSETAAHLDVLADDGRITMQIADGVTCYAPLD
ncbi:MAG: MBL fold metallo-hydrolase [Propionibacteriales bacterium]|nr:MBL fold metallo-hydrolase [Propionibacteriales bacterium]